MAMVQAISYGFTSVENPLSNGGNFTTQFGYSATRVPSSGICEPTATNANCGAAWTGSIAAPNGLFPADQYSEITIAAFTGSNDFTNPQVRMSTAAQQWYQLSLSGVLGVGSTQTLFAVVAGVSNSLGTFTGTVALNDVWRLQISGNVLTVTQNGTNRLTVTDNTFGSTIVSGQPGFVLFNSTAIADSEISLFAAGANQAVTPTFNPIAGSYAVAQNVMISSSTPGGIIYYTTNGSTPTHSSASIANGGFVTVATPLTLKAIASVPNFLDSATGSAVYSGSLTPNSGSSSWLTVANQNFLRGLRH